MMQTVEERYKRPLSAETLRKLEISRRQAEQLVKREIKCPICGFYLLDVYGTEHNITRAKCKKCKFDEPIETAMFRTLKRGTRHRVYSRKNRPLR